MIHRNSTTEDCHRWRKIIADVGSQVPLVVPGRSEQVTPKEKNWMCVYVNAKGNDQLERLIKVQSCFILKQVCCLCVCHLQIHDSIFVHIFYIMTNFNPEKFVVGTRTLFKCICRVYSYIATLVLVQIVITHPSPLYVRDTKTRPQNKDRQI